MSGFKEPSFADRQKAAQEARKNILNKFRAKPGPDDPAVMKRQAEREALAAERAKARLAREAAKAEQWLVRRRLRHRPPHSSRAKRKRPPPGNWRLKRNARQRAMRAMPRARRRENSVGFERRYAEDATDPHWRDGGE